MSNKIEFRPADLSIKELADGTEFVAIKNGFDEQLIEEMKVSGVQKYKKREEVDNETE